MTKPQCSSMGHFMWVYISSVADSCYLYETKKKSYTSYIYIISMCTHIYILYFIHADAESNPTLKITLFINMLQQFIIIIFNSYIYHSVLNNTRSMVSMCYKSKPIIISWEYYYIKRNYIVERKPSSVYDIG